MPTDIAQFFENYGGTAGVLLLLGIFAIPLTRWIVTINGLVKDNIKAIKKLEEGLKDVHLGCHIPIGAVKALEDKVSDLEIKDTELDGDVKEINEHLKSLDITVDLIHKSIAKVDGKLDQIILAQVIHSKRRDS